MRLHPFRSIALWLLASAATAAATAAALPFPLTVPRGFTLELVSSRVPGARFLAVAPNGEVLVSLPGRGQVVALGAAEPRVVAEGLDRPHGLAFRGWDLYIATWTRLLVLRDYPKGRLETLADDLPRNGGHNLRALAVGGDGSLFVSVGSTCNVCEEQDPRLATVLRYPPAGGRGTIFAKGLRNASGLAFDGAGRLWAVVNQRDNLVPDHTDLPPDELDLLVEGAHYGWPYAYPEGRQRKPNPEFPEARTEGYRPTDLNLQAHSAPLQSVFYEGTRFPAPYRGSLFIALHGSWNRHPPTGYKVVAVSFRDGKPAEVRDFITGWLTDRNQVLGRPVGLAVDTEGALYISDDRGYIFRVRWNG